MRLRILLLYFNCEDQDAVVTSKGSCMIAQLLHPLRVLSPADQSVASKVIQPYGRGITRWMETYLSRIARQSVLLTQTARFSSHTRVVLRIVTHTTNLFRNQAISWFQSYLISTRDRALLLSRFRVRCRRQELHLRLLLFPPSLSHHQWLFLPLKYRPRWYPRRTFHRR